MNNLVQRIRNNTFRVQSEKYIGKIGTAFAISSTSLITSNHVVNPDNLRKPEYSVHLVKPGMESYLGRITKIDMDADLTLISTESDMNIEKPFFDVTTPPEIGQECIWGGFPKLIGEHSPRLRFAKGIVSSEKYGVRNGYFFELDGIFSPGHSGSAVIHSESGMLVGVVSRSAGTLDEQFYQAAKIFEAINLIQSSWGIFENMMKTMTTLHENIDKSLKELEQFTKRISESLGSFSRIPSYYSTRSQTHLWFDSNWRNFVHYKVSDDVIKILEKKGIRVLNPDSNTTALSAESDLAWRVLIELLLEWTQLMEEVVNDSFQMGIGIATCDEPLRKMIK